MIEANGLGAEHGRAIKVRAVGSGGTAEVSGEEARTKLQLKSSWFAVQGQPSPPRIVKPPTGPASPGGGGIDFGSLNQLAEQILPGSSKFLDMATSAMNGRFSDLGGITGPLGQALGVPTLTPDAAGVTQLFEKGMMFFTPGTGPRVLVGKGLERYQDRGGIPALGFPKRDAFR